MPKKNPYAGFYDRLKIQQYLYHADEVAHLFAQVNEARVMAMADSLAEYITKHLPVAIERRSELSDYRTNPYVLLTSGSVMDLSDPRRFAEFLFNTKLYMGLETSFGKSIESNIIGYYPLNDHDRHKWQEPPEKVAEHRALAGLSREQKARRRTVSVWREVDKSCVIGTRRYLLSIKSGPNCINDTQVEAMKSAIVDHHKEWMKQTRRTYPGTNKLDIAIGLTYGTPRTTNNKENQVLVKLLEHGFEEQKRADSPGILIDSATKSIRVYRCVGQDFWSFIGNPSHPEVSRFVYLEVLLVLAKALARSKQSLSLEDRVNLKLAQLINALSQLMLPRNALPEWIREDFSEDELFWLTTALTAFFDQGI